ncbi:MAG: TonB-dependent receptor, partial [Bacteroidetes bacterium]
YQTNENSGEELLIPDATTQDAGLFSVVNYSLPKLELQGGLRYDFRKIDTPDQTADGTLLYPALTRRFGSFNFAFGAAMPLEKMTLRANLSSGFRAPHTSELLSNGVHEGTFQFVVGDPDLTSESATQLDLSIDLGGEHFQFSANPYFNYIRNYIFLAPTDRFQDDIPVFEYRQQNARLFGGETGFHYHPHALHWLHIASNCSIVLAEDDDGKPLPLIPPAQLRTTLKAELSPQGAVRLKAIFIEHVWKMRQHRVADFETRSPDYHVVNAGVNFDLGGKDIKHGLGAHPFHLALGARNLFNVRYIDHLSRLKTLNAPNPGFNFFIELKWHFETGI